MDDNKGPMYPAGQKIATFEIPKLNFKEIAVLKKGSSGVSSIEKRGGGLTKMKMPTMPKEYGLPKVKGWGAEKKASMLNMGSKSNNSMVPSLGMGGMGSMGGKAKGFFGGTRNKDTMSASDIMGVSMGKGPNLAGGAFKATLFGMEKRAKTKDPSIQIKNYLGIGLMGDTDRDGVINMLDCQPLNRKRQGPEEYLQGEEISVQDAESNDEDTTQPFEEYNADSTPQPTFHESVETYETVPEESNEPTTYDINTLQQYNTRSFPKSEQEAILRSARAKYNINLVKDAGNAIKTKAGDVGKYIGGQAQAVGGYVSGKYKNVGDYAQNRAVNAIREKFMTPWERQQREMGAYGVDEKGRNVDIYKQLQIARLQQENRVELAKVAAQQSIGAAQAKSQGQIGAAQARWGGPTSGGGFNFGLSGMGAMQSANLGQAGGGIMMTSAIPSSGMGMAQMSRGSMTPAEAKVSEALGLGGMTSSMPTMPSSIPTPTMQAPPRTYAAPVSTSENVCPVGTVYSNSSKRCVAFTRGKYNKTRQQ